MPEEPTVLPTPRAFLTNLIASLQQRQQPDAAAAAAVHDDDDEPTRAASASSSANPLRDLQDQPQHKNAFLTLHVLFPNELLPALDLLDRGLVTRFVVASADPPADETTATAGEDAYGLASRQAEQDSAQEALEHAAVDVAATARVAETGAVEASNVASNEDTCTTNAPKEPETDPTPQRQSRPQQPRRRTRLYYVRSAQQQHRSRYHHHRSRSDSHESSTTFYEVRLAPWNCSCPAFAFSAFPAALPSPSSSPPSSPPQRSPHLTSPCPRAQGDATVPGDVRADDGDDDDLVWQLFGFGGLRRGGLGAGISGSSSGAVGSGGVHRAAAEPLPPVCKHLLACLLVERVPRLFGGCVEEKVVSAEEAAGWAAGWGG